MRIHSIISGIMINANKIKGIVLKCCPSRLIIYEYTVPSSQVSFFNKQNLPWEWDTYIGQYGSTRKMKYGQCIQNDWFLRCVRYLKVYQNVNNSFNLNYKPSFYGMWFTSYTIEANSAMYNLCDVINTLFWIRQCL